MDASQEFKQEVAKGIFGKKITIRNSAPVALEAKVAPEVEKESVVEKVKRAVKKTVKKLTK